MTFGKRLRLRSGQGRISAVTILVGRVMLLVPALAWMQYQWLGQLSTAERERMQRTLRTAAAQFATEFDTRAVAHARRPAGRGPTIRDQNWTAYAQRYSAWANSTSEPRLVRDVWLVDTSPAPRCRRSTAPRLFRSISFAFGSGTRRRSSFEDAPWPERSRRRCASVAGDRASSVSRSSADASSTLRARIARRHWRSPR